MQAFKNQVNDWKTKMPSEIELKKLRQEVQLTQSKIKKEYQQHLQLLKNLQLQMPTREEIEKIKLEVAKIRIDKEAFMKQLEKAHLKSEDIENFKKQIEVKKEYFK